jgi:hypothetical protein
MAYFPNGTSFADWQADHCAECLNYRDNGSGSYGCAIADSHFVFDYHEGTNATILDSLIPNTGPDVWQCRMRLTQAQIELETRASNYQLDLQRYEAAMAETRAKRIEDQVPL